MRAPVRNKLEEIGIRPDSRRNGGLPWMSSQDGNRQIAERARPIRQASA